MVTRWLVEHLYDFSAFTSRKLNTLIFYTFALAIASSAGIGYLGLTLFAPNYNIEPALPQSISTLYTRVHQGHQLTEQEFKTLFKFYTVQWEDAKRHTLALENDKSLRSVTYNVQAKWRGIPMVALFPYIGANHQHLAEIARTTEPNIAPILRQVYISAGWHNRADEMYKLMLDNNLIGNTVHYD